MKNAIQWMSEEAFQSAVREAATTGAKPSAEICVRKEFSCEVRAEAAKPIQMCISTDEPDRYNSTLSISGWNLDGFRKNPVVLFQHDRWSMPVAKCTRIWVEGNRLMAELEFAPPEVNEDAPRIEAALRKGFLNAASVGFRPLEYGPRMDADGDGLAYTKQELLEFSIVVVPGQASAVATQRGLAPTASDASARADDLKAYQTNTDARLAALEARVAPANGASSINVTLDEAAIAAAVAAKQTEKAEEPTRSALEADPAKAESATAPSVAPAPVLSVNAKTLSDEIAAAVKASGIDLAELLGH